MSDIADDANKTEEELRAWALANQAAHDSTAGKTVEDSAEGCAICDDEIPLARRAAVPGVETCVACQEELERATRSHTRGYL